MQAKKNSIGLGEKSLNDEREREREWAKERENQPKELNNSKPLHSASQEHV